MSKTVIKPRINASFYDFIPRPNTEDKKRLKESIIKNGVEIPIIINKEGFILDGHTRFEICIELGIAEKIPYEIKRFNSDEDERKFVVMTNISRRHLNKFQKIELSWPLLEIEKKRAAERVEWKNNPELCKIDKKTGKIIKAKKKIKEGLASELFGKKIGLGKTIINQAEYIKKYAPEELILQCRNGEISISVGYYLLRGLKLLPEKIKPEKPINFCPDCNSKTTSPKKNKCHLHKWFCCEHCRWGI